MNIKSALYNLKESTFFQRKNDNPLLKHNKGFTLVELLVVLTILSIVGAVGVTLYTSTQTKLRDHKRKSDIKEIAKALNLYYYQNRSFPPSWPGATSDGGLGSSDTQPWIPGLVPDYIHYLPVDPINQFHGTTDPRTYLYGYISNDPTDYNCPQTNPWFILGTRLEVPNDPESVGQNPELVWCDGVTPIVDTAVGTVGAAYYYVIVERK